MPACNITADEKNNDNQPTMHTHTHPVPMHGRKILHTSAFASCIGIVLLLLQLPHSVGDIGLQQEKQKMGFLIVLIGKLSISTAATAM